MTREIEPLVNALIQAVKMERDLFNETSDDYSTEALMLAKERTALCKKALLEARTPPEATGTRFERGCFVIMELMQAYERRVRTDCTTQEQIEKRPWECAEYIKAAEYLRAVWPAGAPIEPQGWQPIETAPADTDVLLYCPDRHYTNPERVELGQAKNTKGGSAHSWATHWMPLPSAPSTKAGS